MNENQAMLCQASADTYWILVIQDSQDNVQLPHHIKINWHSLWNGSQDQGIEKRQLISYFAFLDKEFEHNKYNAKCVSESFVTVDIFLKIYVFESS